MKVLLWGPLSPKGLPSRGGFEATNRKIADKLEEEGFTVLENPNPVVNQKWGFLGRLVYLKLFVTPLKLLRYIGGKDVILHITPLDRGLIYPSVLTVWFAHFLKIPVFVHILAGTFFMFYDSRGPIYRSAVKLLIKNASAVGVEGETYISQLKEKIGYNGYIMYFPTTVSCRNLPIHNTQIGKFNLFYFGRLNKAKGVNTMIEIIEMLDDRFHLFLDGFISDDIDVSRLNSSKITYLGIESKSQLKETMKAMTIFIFPTTHVGEGQANSLVEAMSEGLIPVTSDQGFCSEVVGDCGVVLSTESTAEDYKNAILRLCNKDLNLLSQNCQKRIKTNHNLDIVAKRLNEYYSLISKT